LSIVVDEKKIVSIEIECRCSKIAQVAEMFLNQALELPQPFIPSWESG
jgi:hypothetical protein